MGNEAGSSKAWYPPVTHRAMFKLGSKKLFVLCLLVKNVPALTALTGVILKSLKKLPGTWIGFVGTSHIIKHTILSILAISDSCSQLAVLDQSLSLCYRFILLVENYARISKSPPSLNAAVWELDHWAFPWVYVTKPKFKPKCCY